MRRPRWLRPWAGIQEAKEHLAAAEADRVEMQEITVEIRQQVQENHITARVHAAMRGGR